MPFSVYVHVPFCLSRCAYCAFYSGEPLSRLGGYPELVAGELALRARAGAPHGPVETVYFGGGTPSLLGPSGVARVLEAADRLWTLASGAEVTIETNPGVPGELAGLAAAGATRLSIGVQSLFDPVLARLGRPHTAAEALLAIGAAARAGFSSVSADLLFGLPGLDPRDLERHATRLLDAGADHVSAYSLELHAGTALAEDAREGRFEAAGPEEELAQWEALDRALSAAGCFAYEVSNYARRGTECRHNLAYWSRASYLGVGPGAHSFQAGPAGWGTRSWNAQGLASYARSLAAGELPPRDSEVLTAPEALLEALFLATRRPKPLDVEALASAFGLDARTVASAFAEAAAGGLFEPVSVHPRAYRPTRAGLRRADGLAVWLHRALAPA